MLGIIIVFQRLAGTPMAPGVVGNYLVIFGEMWNLILLEKVEELTLYLIEQQKEIQVLKEAIPFSKK